MGCFLSRVPVFLAPFGSVSILPAPSICAWLSLTCRCCRSLTSLDLPHNNIGDKGALALAQVLAATTTITQVDLSHNNIGEAGMAAITEVRGMWGQA